MRSLYRTSAALVISFLLLSANTALAVINKTTESGLFRIELQIEPGEPVVGNNAAILTVYDARSQAKIDDAVIEIIPWMTMHGHGSSKKPTVKKLAPGQYRVENLYFTMEGDWDLMFTVKTKTGKDTATLTISSVKNR